MFWAYIGLSFLVYIALAIVAMIPDLASGALEPSMLYFIIMCPITAVKVFYMDYEVWVKRLHDIDRSGWYLILLHIPMIGIFVPTILFLVTSSVVSISFWILMATTKGNPKPNKYGNPPK